MAANYFDPVPGKEFRGTRKRLRRITWRKNTPIEFWLPLIGLLFAVILVVTWWIQHPFL